MALPSLNATPEVSVSSGRGVTADKKKKKKESRLRVEVQNGLLNQFKRKSFILKA